MADHPDQTNPVRRMTCCCCGASTLGRQWWNRDTGYGLCTSCIDCCQRGQTAESFEQAYGVRGVHFDVQSAEVKS